MGVGGVEGGKGMNGEGNVETGLWGEGAGGKDANPIKLNSLLLLAGAALRIIFVVTNISRDQHNFVATNVLSGQAYFCHDKHVSVATKHVFFFFKLMQIFVATNNFVATSIHLSRQKTCFVLTNTCLSRQTRVLLSRQK